MIENWRPNKIISSDFYWYSNTKLRFSNLKSKNVYWKLLNSKKIPKMLNEIKWENDLECKINFKCVYLLPYRICIETKLISFHYKILHRIIPTQRWLFLRKIVESECCIFCGEQDNILHYFCNCIRIKTFWDSVFNWWKSLDVPPLNEWTNCHIILGFEGNEIFFDAINFMVMLGKWHIYCSKKDGKKPDLYTFLYIFKNYLSKLRNITERNTRLNLNFIDIFSLL